MFHGGITIHAGADGSEADLSNKNLLLSADAEIDTQPVLEIHADEVKAAHGATVGQLDANRAVLPALARPRRSRRTAPADRVRSAARSLSGIDDDALRAQLDTALERGTGTGGLTRDRSHRHAAPSTGLRCARISRC